LIFFFKSKIYGLVPLTTICLIIHFGIIYQPVIENSFWY